MNIEAKTIIFGEKADTNKFIKNMEKYWGYKNSFLHEIIKISEKQEEMKIEIKLENEKFTIGFFKEKFDQNIGNDIKESRFAEQGYEIYKNHDSFYMILVESKNEKKQEIYSKLTKIILTILISSEDSEMLVYNIDSRQGISKKNYLEVLDDMLNSNKKTNYIFPVGYYVDYKIYVNNKKLNLFTIGFDKFNDYELEIKNKDLSEEQLLNIIDFITENVIYRNDKIHNMDIIPVPLNNNFAEGILKKNFNTLLNKELLTLIF